MSDISQQHARLWHDARWRAVVAAFVLNGLLFGAWASRVPAFKSGFELSAGTLGLLLLALAGGAIVSFPLAGMLSERIGTERLTVRCAWAYAPALVLLALAPSNVFLAFALFIFGALHGAMDVAMNGWAARVEAQMNRPTMSIFHAMFSLGAGVGAASGFVAASLGFVPILHFLLVAIIGGATALWVMIPLQNRARPAPTSTGSQPLTAMPSKSLLLVGIIAFSISMGEGAMADWSAVFLSSVVNVSEAQAALGYAAFSTMMVLTRLAGGGIVHRLGPVATTRISGLIAFIGLSIVIYAEILALSLVGFALIGVGYAVVMPLVFSRAANDPDTRPGPAIASVATLGYGGMLLGPPVVGFVAQVSSLQMSFAALGVLAMLAVVLAACLRVRPNAAQSHQIDQACPSDRP